MSGDPQRVGPIGCEVAVHQVRRPRGVGIGNGGEHLLASSADPANVQLTHQPCGLVATDVMAGTPGCLPQFVRAVDLLVGDPQHHQHLQHDRITHRPIRRIHRRRRAGRSTHPAALSQLCEQGVRDRPRVLDGHDSLTFGSSGPTVARRDYGAASTLATRAIRAVPERPDAATCVGNVRARGDRVQTSRSMEIGPWPAKRGRVARRGSHHGAT